MNDETLAKALDMVKARLSRLDDRLDEYLKARIRAAHETMTGWGIRPDYAGNRDLMFLVDLTVWQYGNRDSNTGRPEWLRKRINDRWFEERRETT